MEEKKKVVLRQSTDKQAQKWDYYNKQKVGHIKWIYAEQESEKEVRIVAQWGIKQPRQQ